MKLIAAIIIMFLSLGCNLPEKDERLLAEHKKTDENKIMIYYIGGGATTSDVMQVRKFNYDKPLWVNKKYNYLQSSKLINDTLLQLVLSDTGYHNNNNKLDTIILNVK